MLLDIKTIVNYLLSRKKWILILAVLGVLVCVFVRIQMNKKVPRVGDMKYSRIVLVNPIPSALIGNQSSEYKLNELSKTMTFKSAMIDRLESGFEMEELCRGWNKFSLKEKDDWVTKHFLMNYLASGTYELHVQFLNGEGKNSSYVEDNRTQILDLYQQMLLEKAKLINSACNIEVLDNGELIDTEKINRSKSILKYAIFGFFFGGTVGCFIFAVKAVSIEFKKEF